MFRRRSPNWKKRSQHSPRPAQANSKHAGRPSRRTLRLELLEDRSMLALLGVAPLDAPIISYDSGGTVSYDAVTGAFSLTAIPLDIDTAPFSLFYSGNLNINIEVDAAGALVGGIAGDDLVLTGDVDVDGDFVVDYVAADGPLLKGEILAFGSQDSGGTTDAFDFRFLITGGQLASLYAGKDLGVTTGSENSTFAGDFGIDFGGNAKGLLGGVETEEPGIKIKKFTNGVDADTEAEAAQILPGGTVTWRYEVTNTGGTSFTFAQVVVTDDNGTPLDPSDDFHPTFDATSDVGSDGILSPGEVWTYEASAIAEDLSTPGATSTFHFDGENVLDGPDGNIRTFTAGGLSVRTSAWSRSDTGVWDPAWLGAYGGGLGVTDNIEGDGGGDGHTVDNVRYNNYVLFEFSETIIADAAFLGYVVNDSDLTIWIGSAADPFNNHLTLSDALLSGLGFTELNLTNSSSTRWANFNAGNVAGNVLVIAARTDDPQPHDRFKIEKVKVQLAEEDCYQNYAYVTTGPDGPTDSDVSHYCNPTPGIMIVKSTNGIDANHADNAPQIEPGDLVTWTYTVTNTGTLAYALNEVVLTDDNGTPNNPTDDFHPAFDPASDVHDDGILSPGEVWTYTASTTALELVGSSGSAYSYTFSGNNSTTGPVGNIRTFTAGGVSVHASAFSREKGNGNWQTAYLGGYDGGLGVTDTEENGTNTSHTVDNNNRNNYVLFEFSEQIVVDSLFLGFVAGDSDLTVWIGSTADPFNNHMTLSDAVLAGLGFTEVNLGGAAVRTADINAGKLSGNVLVVAAKIGDSYDYFKIEKLRFNTLEAGIYRNVAHVVAPGAADEDASHYRNPIPGDDAMVKFYVVDPGADRTFQYNRGGEWLANNNLGGGNTNSRGVATTVAGDKLWVIDGSHKVYVYGAGGALLGSWIATGLTTPEDITTDGTDIWIVDNGAKKVFKFSNAASRLSGSQTADSSFALTDGSAPMLADAASYVALRKLSLAPALDTWHNSFGSMTDGPANGTTPSFVGNGKGIVTDGSHLWVVSDGPVDKVLKYTLAGALVGCWTIDARNSSPTGITLDPSNVSHLWIVDSEDDAVYRYHGATNRTWGSQSADRVFQLATGNQDAQGIADPLPAAVEIALAPLVETVHLATISPELTSVAQDKVVTTKWAPVLNSDVPLPANRSAQKKIVSQRNPATRLQLDVQLTALDAAFEVREDDDAIMDDDCDWLYDEEFTASDDVGEAIAEEALAAAFGV